jgi:hypothetical protein
MRVQRVLLPGRRADDLGRRGQLDAGRGPTQVRVAGLVSKLTRHTDRERNRDAERNRYAARFNRLPRPAYGDETGPRLDLTAYHVPLKRGSGPARVSASPRNLTQDLDQHRAKPNRVVHRHPRSSGVMSSPGNNLLRSDQPKPFPAPGPGLFQTPFWGTHDPGTRCRR